MTTLHALFAPIFSFALPGEYNLIACDVEDKFDFKSDLAKVAPWRENLTFGTVTLSQVPQALAHLKAQINE